MKKKSTKQKKQVQHPRGKQAVKRGTFRPVRILHPTVIVDTSAKRLFPNLSFQFGAKTLKNIPSLNGIASGPVKMAASITEYFEFLKETPNPLQDIIKYNIEKVDWENGDGHWVRVFLTKGTYPAHRERILKLLQNEGFVYSDKPYTWGFYRTQNYIALGFRSKRSGYTPTSAGSLAKQSARDATRHLIQATGHPPKTVKRKNKNAKKTKKG